MTPTPLPAESLGPADRPLVLLPVRLETRFSRAPDGGSVLKIRVYPDTIYADTHEAAVTASEAEWGRHYWRTVWRAATDEERRKAAWRQLAERYEPQRAAWVVWHLRPRNPEERPGSPMGPDDPLSPEPRFPEPPELKIQAEPWTRAPWSRVLPDRWIAVGYTSGALVAVGQGRPIPDPLPLGPSPTSDLVANDEQPPADDGMKWMIDFDEAVRLGMGMELVLPSFIQSLDRLLVFGLKGSLDGESSAARLAELLAAHSYTQGFSFPAPGTPSNNTTGIPSGFSSVDPGYDTSYQATQTQERPDDASNGGLVAMALGIPAATFARIERAAAHDMTDAQHMNTALWQATWGSYLEQMMRDALPVVDTEVILAWLRRHFIEHVRAAGPLPAVRCGRQPYGLLPVSSLDLWAVRPEDVAESERIRQLLLVLTRLRAVWLRGSAYAARVGKSADPKQDLQDVLRLQPSSGAYAIRAAIGRHYFQNLWQFQLVDLGGAGWWTRLEQLAGASLNGMGFPGLNSRLNNTAYADAGVPLKGPLSEPPQNFMNLLLHSSIAAIRDEAFPNPKPNSLLYKLLRHSTLLEFTNAAQNILIVRGMMTVPQRREPEIIDVDPGTTVFTTRRQLATVVPALSSEPLESYLQQLTSFDHFTVAQLGEFRASLERLSGLAAPELERLMTGTLDLCSYRLDAWITSLATRRLMAMRKANPTGVYLGGYGWVENLRPSGARPTAATVPEESTPPPFALPDNPGFIHAPSLAQAATAAVLRSAHLTHQNAESGKLLAIDLSSARVRLAKWLLDGVRAGQPLGALLGYRFERGLHEGHPGIELDRFIALFRRMAPLAPATLHPADGLPVELIAANNVVDGLKLQQIWRQNLADEAAFFARLAPLSDAQRDALRAELMALDDNVDAVSDALLAEGVHQAVAGNPSRASATLDAVARGDVRPPELDVIETPRSGIALTHRALALFSGPAPVIPGWPQGRFPFRAEAEPHLNSWAGELLGDPALVRCRVERFDPATGATVQAVEVRLSDLGLTPLDLVYAAEPGAQVQRSEIEQRLLMEAARQAPGLGPDEALRVNLDRDPSWSVRDLSGNEFFELLRAVRAMITRARGIDGRDLVATGVAGISGIDDNDLRQRAARALTSLEDALAGLRTNRNGETLLALAHFGIPGAIPSDPAQLAAQAQSAEREAAGRLARARAAETPLDTLREIFGSTFVVAPLFVPPNAADLAATWAASERLQGGNPMEAVTWLARAARVREGIARLEDAFRYAEALGTGAELTLRVGQLPLRDGDRWVALPFADGKPIGAGALSLVAQVGSAFNPALPLAGLLLDEWIETVPNATETTAVAFQYDQPDATPPQSILIAVPPGADLGWTAAALQKVLVETMDLAKMRVVDPSLLGETQHFLPALYFASNAQGDTVSTDWTSLTR